VTTARGLLMRLLSRGRIDPAAPAEGEQDRSAEPPAEVRLDAAKQRLQQTIPPPEEGAPPEEGSSPAFGDPPPNA
jgi:hypothetical protein